MKTNLIKILLPLCLTGILNHEISAAQTFDLENFNLKLNKEYKSPISSNYKIEDNKFSINTHYKINNKLSLNLNSNIKNFNNYNNFYSNSYNFASHLNYYNFTLTGAYGFGKKDINISHKDYGLGLNYIYKNAIVNFGYKQKDFEEFNDNKEKINSNILFSLKAGYNVSDNFTTYAEASFYKLKKYDDLQDNIQKLNKEKAVVLMIGTKVNF